MSQTSDSNKATALRLWEQALNKRNFAVLPEINAPGYTFNGAPQSNAEIELFIDWINSQAPGYEFVVQNAVAEDDLVALYWQINIPAGNLIASTGGKAAHGMGANFLTFVNGLVTSNNQAGGLADVVVNS